MKKEESDDYFRATFGDVRPGRLANVPRAPTLWQLLAIAAGAVLVGVAVRKSLRVRVSSPAPLADASLGTCEDGFRGGVYAGSGEDTHGPTSQP